MHNGTLVDDTMIFSSLLSVCTSLGHKINRMNALWSLKFELLDHPLTS